MTDNSNRDKAKAKRESFLKDLLNEVRVKRQSKGIHAAKTPSNPVIPEPPEKEGANAAQAKPVAPILSLTKLDFEFLREYDWKERKQRLETWKVDLGLAKAEELYKKKAELGHKRKSSTARRTSNVSKKEADALKKEQKDKEKFGRTGLTLKRDLDQLTGMRVRPPPTQQQPRKPSQGKHIKTSDKPLSGVQAPTKVTKTTGGLHPPSKAMQQQKLEEKSTVQKKALQKRRVLQARARTFGKGWTEKHQQPQRSLVKTWAKQLQTRPDIATATQSSAPSTAHSTRLKELKSDVEEEQPPTAYSKASRGAHSESSLLSHTDSEDSIGFSALFKSLHETAADKADDEDDDNMSDLDEESKDVKAKPSKKKRESPPKYQKHAHPPEFQDTCFGSIKFVDKTSLKPTTKHKGEKEYLMLLDDEDLSVALGKTDHLRIKFFKAGGAGAGRSDRILAREANEKMLKARQEQLRLEKEQQEAEEDQAPEVEPVKKKHIIKNFAELPAALQLNPQDRKKYAEKLAEFEKAVLKIPAIGSNYRIEVEQVSQKPSEQIPTESGTGTKAPKRNMFTRPPRRVWYTPLPLTVKRYYRTNWKKIRFDVRKEMSERNFWPKLWINFEETHPKKMFELIKAKLAVKQFDQYGYKRDFDWGKGIHPDYIDWILEDIAPHPGKYYYDDDTREDPVRKASYDEDDFPIKDWFMKPPRYIPDTPPSPPFDQLDFCGYGTRENAYFLDFTLPREIMHYYAPPSRIEQFFREISKPPYAFPGYTFKRWLKFPLEKKLPQYFPFPKRFSIWTRGKIGDSLQVRSSEFRLGDPFSLKTDIRYNPYHDPHTRKYFLKKPILDRLWELGIINSKGEVKCTMKEFNQNRIHLREYEWLEECTRRWTNQWASRLQHNEITKETNIANLDWESKNRVWQERLDRCQAYRKIRDEEEEKEHLERVKRYEEVLQHIIEIKHKIRIEMILRAKKRRKEQRARKKTLHNLEVGRKILLQRIYAQRHKRAVKNRKKYHSEKMMEQMEKKNSSWNRHVDFAHKKMEELKELEKKLEDERSAHIAAHKKKMIQVWREVPRTIIRKREKVRQEENRKRQLLKKYFYIWLKKTRRRRMQFLSGDYFHGTVWPPSYMMQSLVSDLKKKSHFVKVEDVLFNAIQKRIGETKENIVAGFSSSLERLKKEEPTNDKRVTLREVESDFVDLVFNVDTDEEDVDELGESKFDIRPETVGYEGDVEEN